MRPVTKWGGKLGDLSDTSLNVLLHDKPQTFAQADVRLVKRRQQDSLWNGLLIGTAVGAAPAIYWLIDFLTIELPAGWGIPKFRLRPESVHDFFVAELPLRVTFRTDTDGRPNGVLVYPPRGRQAVPAMRIR